MEQLKRLVHLSPTGRVFEEMLKDLTPPGSPVYTIPDPSELGYPERKDTDARLTPSQMNESIFHEGLRLAGTEVVDIGNNRELLVFNTTAASTHTVLSVNYQEWDWALRRQASELGIEVPKGPLIVGRNSTDIEPKVPTIVPLDMVTWVMVKDRSKGTYMPCDVNDLTSLAIGNEAIDQHKLQLSDEKLQELFGAISKRNRLAIHTILDLHNNVLKKEMPFMNMKKEEDLLIGCLSGYYRGDEAKQLKQFEHDHLGKGPMSNPTLHFRITDHFSMEDANILDQRNPSLSFRDSINLLKMKYPTYFSGSIDFAAIKPEVLSDETEAEVLQRFFENNRFSLYDLIKSIDPYASLAHEYLSEWLQYELGGMFHDIDHIVEPFEHHTSDYERELRVSEGASVTIATKRSDNASKDSLVAESYARISQWIGRKLYPMWNDIQDLVKQKVILEQEEYRTSVDRIVRLYNLPLGIEEVIESLQPTEKQLKLFKTEISERWHDPNKDVQIARIDRKLKGYQRKKLRNAKMIQEGTAMIQRGEGTLDDLIGLLTLIQSSQIYDNEGLPDGSPKLNDGYNIPGVPGTAMTYAFDHHGHLKINIGWLLSTKGLSELWLGSIMKRKERRDR